MEGDDVAETSLLLSSSTQKTSSGGSVELPARDNVPVNPRNLFYVNFVLLLVGYGTQTTNTVLPQYMYYRTSELLYNTTVSNTTQIEKCFQNESDPNFLIQEHVQQVTTGKLTALTLSNSIPTIFTVAILGACMDYLGRKKIYLIAIFGHLSRNICLAAVIYWKLNTDYLYIGFGADGLCGGFCALGLVGFAFTADQTERSGSRTLGIGVLLVVNGVAIALGQVLTGYFIDGYGFFYPMLASVIITFTGLALAVILVSETLRHNKEKTFSLGKGFRNVFGFYYSKKYAGQRFMFCLAIAGFFLTYMSVIVQLATLDTLYELNAPFCWDSVTIGLYSAANVGLLAIVGLFWLKIMQRCLAESTIALIGIMSLAAKEIYISFCDTDLMLYFAPVLGMFSFGILAITRSLLSKMAPTKRQGSVLASAAFVEAILYTAGSPFFNVIYQATVQTFRGAVYQVMGLLHIVDFFIYLLLFNRLAAYNRKQKLFDQLVITQNETHPNGKCPEDEYEIID